MGWAGPAQPTGPDSAQNCWADLGPKMDWADLGPNTIILFWARPGPEDWAGPGPAWPSNNRWRGELFSPHPCMQNATRSACREGNEKYKRENEGEEKLPGAEEAVRRWRCCGRGWWRCRSSRTAAPGGAAAVPNVRRCYCFFFQFSTRFQLFPFLPMFRSSLFLPFPLFSQSVFYVFLSSRFLSSFGSSSLSPLFLFSPSPPSPCSRRSWGPIYRAKGVALYCSHGEQPAGRPLARLPRSGPPPRLSGRCAVGGRPLCPVGGLQAREWPAKIQIKAKLFPSSPLRDRGKKMNSVVQNDTVLLFLFFFFFS